MRLRYRIALALGVLNGQDNQAVTLSAPPASSAPVIRGGIWSVFRIDVEKAGMKSGAIRIARPEGGGLDRGYGFVFDKRPDGRWHCIENERK
jgi:hypothetical protein